MSLREYIKRHVSNTYKLDILSSMYCLDGQLHLRKKCEIIYRISSYSFRGNYSFFGFENPKVKVHKAKGHST